MNIEFGRMVMLVRDYDEALDFYKTNFNAKILFDENSSFGLRFLHVGIGNGEAGIWFLKADGKQQEQLVGSQTHQQPAMVLYTDDIDTMYERLLANNVRIEIAPVDSPQYSFLHCYDLYGNEIVIVQLKQ